MHAGSQKLFTGVIGKPCLLQSCCLGRRKQLFHGTSELHIAIFFAVHPLLGVWAALQLLHLLSTYGLPSGRQSPRVLSCPAANGDCRGPVAGVLPCPAVPPWGGACAPQYPAQQGCLHLRGGTVNQEHKCFEAAFPAMSTAGEGPIPAPSGPHFSTVSCPPCPADPAVHQHSRGACD